MESCVQLLFPLSVDETLKMDRYHPSNCNTSSMNHHHPFHNHMNRGMKDIIDYRNDERMDTMEWIQKFKQIPNTNIYIDAFMCYPKINKIKSTNPSLTNLN